MATREELQQAMLTAHRAGDTANAQRLAQAISAMDKAQPDQQPLGILGAIKGAADVGIAGLRGTGNQLMGTAFGLGGAIHGAANRLGVPGTEPSSFMQGRDAYLQAARDDQTLIKEGRLRTPEGQRVAEWISNLPLSSGGPAALRVSDINRAFENVLGGIENVAGPEARDIVTSAATLATAKAGPARPASVAADAVAQAGRAGYMVPPTAILGYDIPLTERALAAVQGRRTAGEPIYAGSTADRAARTWGGSPEVDARIAMRNQQVTQQLAAESAKLPEMTPAAVEKSAKAASSVYDTIKSLTGPNGGALYVPLQSQNFYNRVMALDKTPGWNPALPSAPDSIAKLRNELLSVNPTVEGVVNRVRQLREDSFKNFNGDAEAQNLGRAQREAADILDDELSDRLQFISRRATNPNLRSIATRIFDEYTDARAQLSRLHNLRNVMNGSTGTIDAAKVSRMRAQGYKIEPQLDEIANAYDAFGGTGMQTTEKAAKVGGTVSPLDIGSGAFIGFNAGSLAGGGKGSLIGGVIGGLAVPFSRYAAQEFALRSPGARVVGNAARGITKAGARGAIGGSLIGEQK